MGLLSADNPRDTAIAWAFVAVQAVLIVLIAVLPPGDAWSVPGWLDLAARVLQFGGLAVLVVGLLGLGRSLTPLPTPVDHGRLTTAGLFRWARHPVYAGLDALAVGTAVRSASPAVSAAAVGLVAWFMLKARWEEGHLRDRYPDYAAYAARTPRFVPLWPFGADRSR